MPAHIKMPSISVGLVYVHVMVYLYHLSYEK